MTKDQFEALRPGDLVRHKHSASAFIVHSNYGNRVTAVQVADLTNPREWDVVTPGGSVINPDQPEMP